MEKDLNKIIQNLKNNLYPSEALISQGVVKRILSLFGWPVYDPEWVIPEYSLHGRRVDLALCNTPNRPIMFVEVKQLGLIEGADKQLFEYAFVEGIPIAILTDGREWHFYLPGEQGNYEDRHYLKLDLFKHPVTEIIDYFLKYLEFTNVKNGFAYEYAKKEYKDLFSKKIIKSSFTNALKQLINEEDDILFEVVASKIESLCGYKPSKVETFKMFNENLELVENKQVIQSVKFTQKRQVTRFREKQVFKKSKTGNKPVYLFFGKRFECVNGRNLMRNIFIDFYNRDDQFFFKFQKLRKSLKSRPIVSQSPEGLYPTTPHLKTEAVELVDGWWLDGNLSKEYQEKHIKRACEIENIRFGIELIVQWE